MNPNADEIAALEARLAAVEADLAIRKLISRYAFAMDDRDLESIGDLFTRNARVWSGDGVMNASGRDELVRLYQGRFAKLGATNHFVHDIVIDLEGDHRASGLVSAHAEVWRNGVQQIAALRYQDRYEKEDGAWRIADRKMLYVYYTPVDRYDGILGTLKRNLTNGQATDADVPEKTAGFVKYLRLQSQGG